MKNEDVQVANDTIPFNRPYVNDYSSALTRVFESGHISGNGYFTQKCHAYFNRLYGTPTLLTTSCTSAMEMAALLAGIGPGDEVIMPSFTFVSTANPFLMRGARIVFADTGSDYPNLDADTVESLITKKTKAVVCMHYAGVACEMEKLQSIIQKHRLILIEDAAHALHASFRGRMLGSFGRFATLSFHETKNITAGEGGLIVLNDKADFTRAEILWEKGTNRSAFHRKETGKYEWLDIGSSFLPSDINAAVLYSQIEEIDKIQERRVHLWKKYFDRLIPLQTEGKVRLPAVPEYASINGHLFYLECRSEKERDQLITYLRKNNIHAVFHYLPLHLSPYFKEKHDGRMLENTVRFSNRIIRLPLFYGLGDGEQAYIITKVKAYFNVSAYHR